MYWILLLKSSKRENRWTTTLRASYGISQGRRFNMHAFTTALQVLRVIMEAIEPAACAILPSFARAALEGTWTTCTQPPHPRSMPTCVSPDSAAEAIGTCISTGNYEEARRVAVHLLSLFDDFNKRVQCMEKLGQHALGPLFFVDDIASPYPDQTSVENILRFALPQFEKAAKACFNYGPQKKQLWHCLMHHLQSTTWTCTNFWGLSWIPS